MEKNKVIARLEQDLSFFLIQEACKKDPSKRGSSEMYRYKGLNITTNEKEKDTDKTVAVRIGALEAKFKIENADKVMGNLYPDEERLIQIWLNKSENNAIVRAIFSQAASAKKTIAIIPFDLEDVYTKN